MARIDLIQGTRLRYEIVGEGIPVVFTTGALASFESGLMLAERMGQLGYKMLLWDRPNTAGSDLVFEGENLTLLWADKLHGLLAKLNYSPAFVCGISWGATASLYYAYAYPSDVRGLILVGYPTDDPGIWRTIIEDTFLRSADLAEKGGMSAFLDNLIDGDWFRWQSQFQLCPEKRQQLLGMDPSVFARALRAWADSMRTDRGAYVGGLDDRQLTAIIVPKLFISTDESEDVLHPPRVSQALCKELHNAKLVKMPERFGERWDHMLRTVKENWPASIPDFIAFFAEPIDEFIRSTAH